MVKEQIKQIIFLEMLNHKIYLTYPLTSKLLETLGEAPS